PPWFATLNLTRPHRAIAQESRFQGLGISRVLTADGRLVVISPHPWNPMFRLKRLIDGGRDATPTDHASPLELRRLAVRHGLELWATRALPYTAWSKLNTVFSARSTESHQVRSNLFAGLLRGAFAAEFRRDHRHYGRNRNIPMKEWAPNSFRHSRFA